MLIDTIADFDVTKLSGLAQRALDAQAPAALRLGAARGLLPGIAPVDIVSTVALLSLDTDKQVNATAVDTLKNLPDHLILNAFDAGMEPQILHIIAQHNRHNEALLENIVSDTRAHPETVALLAADGSESLCERIASNSERLLAYPIIIEKLYLNSNTRMSTADRLLEFAVRQNIELDIPAFQQAAAAIRQELISEPSEQPTPDDIIFKRVTLLAEQVSLQSKTNADVVVIDDEGKEVVTEEVLPLWQEISRMTPSQKIRRALLGTDAERMILVRDPNQHVAVAAVRSPKMRENTVVQITSSRSVCSEVLRVIANNRDWTANYRIKYNLVTNPHTPISFINRFIVQLRDHELRSIAKSKNVTEAVSTAARRHLNKKN